jgi:hypothetical protein
MSRGSRLAVSGIALTALLAVVAVASRAHRPGGSTGAGTPHAPTLLFDYVASAMLVLLPLGVILVVWALAQRRHERLLAGETNWRRTLVSLVIMGSLLGAAVYVDRKRLSRTLGGRPSQAQTAHGRAVQPPHRAKKPQPAYHGQFQWLSAVFIGSILLAVAIAAGATYVRKRRGGDSWEREAALAAALDQVLADTLEDLRAERDPRRAVIRTYARMEETFAAYGVARDESEAPLEYVERVLDLLSVSAFSVRRLTQLFSRAKFSPHEVHAGMKEEAIEALAGLRAELEHGRAAAKEAAA